MIKTGISLTDHEKILSMLFGCNGAATAADEVELENKMVIFLREVRGWHSQYKAGTNYDNSISGPERKDGAGEVVGHKCMEQQLVRGSYTFAAVSAFFDRHR